MPATPIGTSFVSDERNNFNGFPNLGSVSPSSGVDRIAILAIAAEFGDPTLIVNAVDWGGRAFQRLGGTRSAAQNTLLDYWILREADYPSATSFLFATLSAPPSNNCCLVLGEGQGVDQGAILSAVTGLVADGAPSALFSQTTSAGDLIFHAAMSSEGTDLAGTPAPDAFGERLRSNDFTLEMSAWGNLPAGTADYGHARVGGEAFSNGLQVLVNIPAAGGGAPNVSVAPSPIGSGAGLGAPTANRIIQLTPQPIGSGAGVGAPTVDPKVPVEPVGIGSGAGLGAPTANRIIQLTPEPIGAGAGLGAPTANRIIRLTPEPIGAGAGVGAPDAQALVEVAPIAIAAGASAGAPQVNFAAQAVDPVAIGSGAGLGAPTVNRIIQLTPEPIGSGGNVGAPLPKVVSRKWLKLSGGVISG